MVCAETSKDEDYAKTIQSVYASPICEIIDDYESGGFYEPSYVIQRAYQTGIFN